MLAARTTQKTIRFSTRCPALLDPEAQIVMPYDDVTPETVVLEERPEQAGYVRPPMDDQTFVPEIHHQL